MTVCRSVCLVGTRRDIQPVKYFAWDDAKNAKLSERIMRFEDIVCHIEHGDLLDILEHANPERFGAPRIFGIRRGDYVSSRTPAGWTAPQSAYRDVEKAKASDARVTVYLGATSTAAHKEHHAGQVKGGLRRDS
jgi:hypothetical protein